MAPPACQVLALTWTVSRSFLFSALLLCLGFVLVPSPIMRSESLHLNRRCSRLGDHPVLEFLDAGWPR